MEFLYLLRRRLPGRGAFHRPLTHEADHASLAATVGFPQLRRGDLGNLFPHSLIGMTFAPVRLEILVIEAGEISVNPAWKMHAVSDRSNRNLPHRQLRPQALPHV